MFSSDKSLGKNGYDGGDLIHGEKNIFVYFTVVLGTQYVFYSYRN